MKRIYRILVAIDGSARSYAALAYLGKLFSKQVDAVAHLPIVVVGGEA